VCVAIFIVHCLPILIFAVDVKVQDISLQVKDYPNISCFLAGSTVVLTCNIVGYPRPPLVFQKSNSEIMPATDERISNISFDQVRYMI